MKIQKTHKFQVIFDYQIRMPHFSGWDFTFIGNTLTHSFKRESSLLSHLQSGEQLP